MQITFDSQNVIGVLKLHQMAYCVKIWELRSLQKVNDRSYVHEALFEHYLGNREVIALIKKQG